MKFVVDGMLGKLARWLRMMGYDVEYSNNTDDFELLKIGKGQRRILLTRDFELYQQAVGKEIDAFYVESETEEERLAELARRFGVKLGIEMRTSRCPKCNSRVKPISKEEVEGKVEKSTFEHYDRFWVCPNCGQVYWQGAHWTRIKETLKSARQRVQKKIGKRERS